MMDVGPEYIGEEDPRTQLVDALREFMVSAVRQQASIDAEQDIADAEREYDAELPGYVKDRRSRRPPGFLYKIDAGYIKVLLVEPAEDEVFEEDGAETPENRSPLPLTWVSVELPPDARLEPETEKGDERAGDLEDILVNAKNFNVKRTYPDRPAQRRVAGDNYFLPVAMDAILLVDMLEVTAPDEEQQKQEAAAWLRDLSRCDLRTIRTSTPESEVA